MRQERAKKATTNSSNSTSAPSTSNGTASAPSPAKCFPKRPLNPKSLVDDYLVSPEGKERAFYVPDFISSEEEQFLISKVRLQTYFHNFGINY